MAAPDAGPRLYLVTPPTVDDAFADLLAPILAGGSVACLRLDLGAAAEEDWVRAANHVQPVAHDAEVALVIADHYRLVAPLGLDGVHLSDGRTPLGTVRKALGPDRIVGAAGGLTRHSAMTLAEAGADYVSLGPVRAAGALGDGRVADDDLFAWWAEMIETPAVAEGGVTPADIARLRDWADFFVPDVALWSAADPAGEIAACTAALEP